MNDTNTIMIFAELHEGAVSGGTRELLAIARKLAVASGQPVAACLLGNNPSTAGDALVALGADRVYLLDNPLLHEYHGEHYAAALGQLCREVKPGILLFPHNLVGRDLAPRVAFQLDTGLALDCVDLEIAADSGALLMTKPVYGGKALAVTVTAGSTPQIASVRSKIVEAAQPEAGRAGEVIRLSPDLQPALARLIERIRQEVTGVKLEEAEIVVSGGRGMGNAENFQHLEKLAGVLGGVVGGSRAAIDAGWLPSTQQVGLTGKIIKPKLYIAVGISGASQHFAGCSGAKAIVAVNKDPEAPIFKWAHFGVVGEWQKVLPPLTEKLRELAGR